MFAYLSQGRSDRLRLRHQVYHLFTCVIEFYAAYYRNPGLVAALVVMAVSPSMVGRMHSLYTYACHRYLAQSRNYTLDLHSLTNFPVPSLEFSNALQSDLYSPLLTVLTDHPDHPDHPSI
jgi:hypothetical protein